MDVDPAALLRVVSAEGVGERLEADAELDEVVESDRPAMLSVELLDEEIHRGRLKTITHHAQSRRQFPLVDETGVVAVVAAKRLLPSSHVVPKLRKLLEVDGSRVIPVKHDNHLTDRLWIKRGPRPVGKRLSKFGGAYLSRTIFVHLGKDIPQELRVGRSSHRFFFNSVRLPKKRGSNKSLAANFGVCSFCPVDDFSL